MTNKYGARKVVVDGIRFDSKAEHHRYEELRMMEIAGEIAALEVHPEFVLYVPVNEWHDFTSPLGYVRCRVKKIGVYHADFRYLAKDHIGVARVPVVEDVKGGGATRTEAYRLRKKIVESCYGIEITEVTR